jgi:hypothetical protein
MFDGGVYLPLRGQSFARLNETANDDGKPAKAARPKKPKAKVEGQREMLLPIAGGKTEAVSETGSEAAAEGRLTNRRKGSVAISSLAMTF